MPDPNILERVNKGTESWNKWRLETGAQTITLAETDLSETSLEGINFSGVDARGMDLYRTNLSGSNFKMINLEGADLSHAILTSVGGYKARLKNAALTEANLEGADLSESELIGADLRGANLRGVNLSGTDLRGARLDHADLSDANLTDADITGARLSFANVEGANLTSMQYGDHKKMRGLFYGIRGLENSFGNALFVRDAKDQDYLDTMEVMIDKLPDGKIKRLETQLFRIWGLIDYGRSLAKVTFYAFLIASIYSCLYTLDMYLEWGLMDYSNSAQSWFTPFYYSIVTYTTLGFGDVTANNWIGEILIISEVIIGYFTLGLLLAILANTIARRS
jgi:hypothetical protein